ncbi:MAG TPA: UDP-2,3-diacylglucosamine diphosphatase [Geobacteraceae bacterium]|jgi:UDP-2,3-diacylglucosamine hydrolase|nr:UDP-2,3-diacylglucosamine diphosphatase [Geobacteraceae bacterium]
MRKVFIADAHLRNSGDENCRKLLSFLAGLQGNTETLFILGDLFEFWIGSRQGPFPHYLPVLERLRELSTSGTELVYFEGNHDFHMGPFFTETLKARVYRGPATIDLDGKRIYLCHGDQINRRDVGYLLLRFVLHNALTAVVARLVPVSVVSAIADRMSRLSRKKHNHRQVKWDYVAILRDFAASRFREGCDAVITGHFHTPLLEKSPNGERTLLSLGDWITHFSYGEWRDGELSLKKFA